MPDLKFEDAIVPEIPAILALSDAGAAAGSDFPSSDPNDPGYLAAFKAISADPNHRLICVKQSNEIIGTLQISFIPGLPRNGMWRGMIENVHVRTDQRGKGVGTAMMQWAIQTCRENDCGMVQLTSNKVRDKAHKFYADLGFKNTHEGFKLYF